VKLDISNLMCRLILMSTSAYVIVLVSMCICMHLGSSDVFNFWEITDDILEMVQDRDLITVEDS